MIGQATLDGGTLARRVWRGMAVAGTLLALLALAAWGYRRPELFLELARFPVC